MFSTSLQLRRLTCSQSRRNTHDRAGLCLQVALLCESQLRSQPAGCHAIDIVVVDIVLGHFEKTVHGMNYKHAGEEEGKGLIAVVVVVPLCCASRYKVRRVPKLQPGQALATTACRAFIPRSKYVPTIIRVEYVLHSFCYSGSRAV